MLKLEKSQYLNSIFHTEKTVSLNQKKISLKYGQGKNFFESKKVSLIQKKFFDPKK